MTHSSRTLTDTGIVLGTTLVRESDVMISLLTGTSGKLSAIARGAKRSKKRFPGGIDIFDCAQFELQSPRGTSHVFTVLSRGSRESWLGIRHHLGKFRLASFCLEVAGVFAPEGDRDGSALFLPLQQALHLINSAPDDDNCYIAATRFVVQLLGSSGVSPIAGGLIAREDVRDWWVLLQQHHDISIETSPGLISESFLLLFGYVEQIIGHRLKTHRHFFQDSALEYDQQMLLLTNNTSVK